MASGRLINIARDKITGKLLNANLLFDQSKKTESFEIRKEFNQDELASVCLECEQDLTITNSDFTNYKIWNQLKNRDLVDIASEKDSLLFILESAKTGIIRGNKLAN
ncbi:DUF6035 family protein [Chryseobacterium sp. R2ACT005]|uniref:DUF7830 domain-containing protein n=1 Tax=Chryseobacterium sp. R2ACT005 TaxID=3416668 RepID=UPI003CF959FD